MKSLLSKLRTKRLCAGLNLKNAARLAGYSIGWLSEAERGKRKIRPEVEKRLIKIFSIYRGKK